MAKKILCNVFLLISLWVSFVYAAKPVNIHYDGEDHPYTGPEVTLRLREETFVASEEMMPPIILQNRTLVPVREVFETLGGKVEWTESEKKIEITFGEKTITLWINQTEAEVDGKTIAIDVPAMLINSKTMVPVRFISEQANLQVEWDPATNTVSISDEPVKLKQIEVTKINDANCLVLTAEKAITGYKYYLLGDTLPHRLVLDVENSIFDFSTQTQTIDNDWLSSVRFGEQENHVNRIVLDLKEEPENYVAVLSQDKTKLYLALASEVLIPGEVEVDPPESGDEQVPSFSGDDPIEVTSGDKEPDSQPPQPQDDEETDPKVTITAVKYSTIAKCIRISYEGDITYQDSFLTNPNRIVIDIASAKLDTSGPKEISPKGSLITKVRFSQYEKNTVRIVLDVSEKVDYQVEKRKTDLQVSVSQPTYQNITYKVNSSNAQITLYGVDKEDLTVNDSSTSGRYTIRYSKSDFDPGKGEIQAEDDYVKTITISSTRIVVDGQDNVTYSMKQSGKNVIITIRDKTKVNTSSSQRVILLDAGHGGNDPGANNGDHYEKTYNLAVLLKLKDLLEEEGYVVYTTREEDVTLTVDDRVTLATEDYPKADLYVSIHHNSIANKQYSGTLVMYCGRDTSEYGITNKRFAEIVLDELVSKLNTVNRGFIVVKETDTSKRVLTEVPMPSILCEIAFVSNDEELERIQTESFQQAAAEAIKEGIQKALEEME